PLSSFVRAPRSPPLLPYTTLFRSLAEEPFDEATLRSYHKLFQLTSEEVEQVLRPLAEIGQEATGSMGDDTPIAVLSRHTRPLYEDRKSTRLNSSHVKIS